MPNLVLSRRAFIAGSLAVGAASHGRLSAAPARSAFRSIRYATADRFGPARPLPFSENLVQDVRGPVCPQRGGLVISMGKPSPNRQDEHCQILSVFTPSRSGKRPVMVFLHGGAFVTGGGELAWYDGDRLALEQDIVVVPVSYRLGAFGFRIPEEGAAMSPGFSDVVAALDWVRRYIHLFGGDPANVTVCGQSAGSAMAMVLNDYGYGGGLYRRIIAMSGNHLFATRDEAAEHSRIFDRTLGKDPRNASPDEIVDAQSRIKSGSSTHPFWLPMAPAKLAPIGADVLAGSLREDLSFVALLSASRRPQPGDSLDGYRALSKPLNDEMRSYAQATAAAGRKAFAYSFDWQGPDTGLGDTHTIDLSFIFGSWAAWQDAPMLAGVDRQDYERMGLLMRRQWAAFARSGNPQIPGGPAWRQATPEEAPLTHIV